MRAKVNDEIVQVHNKLTNDFIFFARNCLKIRTKAGKVVPFELNKAQRYIHQQVEEQKRKTGRVRVLIPKARQGGISTYVSGRFYHRNNRIPNISTFILSHQSTTTGALFKMVDRYHELCPDMAKPKALVSNKRQLVFENGSEYTVGTAGSGDVGRGFTTQLLHLSEAAFFENTDDIQTGILQSVSDEDDTEIFVESTGNGMGNWFYRACMSAIKGEGDYIMIFIPWFWMDEYRRSVPDDFILTESEEALKETYDLDNEQIYWRRKKIEDLKSEWKFMQEYPANVMECFQTSGDPLIDAEKAMRARKRNVDVNPNDPLIAGFDPNGGGKDSADVVFRRGNVVPFYKEWNEKMEPMEYVGKLAHMIDTYSIDKMFIDYGYGHAIVSRLKELGYGEVVQAVNFSERPIEDDKYLNKRAEMACNARDWIAEDNKSIPDDDAFYTDILCVPRERETSRGLVHIESKDNIRKEYGRSPGISDAFWLTFAYPVHKKVANKFQKVGVSSAGKNNGPLKTLNRTRRKNNKNETGGVKVWQHWQ